MIARYTRTEMGRLWELENKYRTWLDVELAACEAWASHGEIPKEALREIKKNAAFNVERIEQIEAEVKHDVIAFLTSVAEYVGPDSRYIHKGLTSSDVVDTATSILMRQASDIIIQDLGELLDVLKRQALAHKDTVCIGRSHGVHAEPMAFGLKFALWYEDMKRNLCRMERAREVISVGKLSGAVGTFSNIPPAIEEKVLKKLGLAPEPVATQVVQRDRHAEYLTTLALIAAGIEKIAVELRHLQRTEVLEAEEPFAKGQKGSSAMPHKRNPIGAENLCGPRARRAQQCAWPRSSPSRSGTSATSSHSSVERVIIPDSTILVDYMLARLTGILDGLLVYPDRMKKNMDASFGLHNSQRVMLALIAKGLTREDAYALVQHNAMDAWIQKKDFRLLLEKDREVRKHHEQGRTQGCIRPGPVPEKHRIHL